MTRFQRAAVGAAILLAPTGACAGARRGSPGVQAAVASAAGTWVGTTSGGRQEFTLLLVQAGDSLYGQLTIEDRQGRHSDPGVAGAVAGNRVTWTSGGRGFKFQGTLKGDTMAGMWGGTYVMVSPAALTLRRRPDTVR